MKIWKIGRRIVPVMLILAASAMAFGFLFLEKAVVYGHSMEPTLMDGQTVLIEKLSCRLWKPSRFDVVVFGNEQDPERYYMKRIVGLPGETVQIVNGTVRINGVILEELAEEEKIREPRRAAEPVVLGDSEYFVLGDNWNDSSDSRDADIGNIAAEEIIGKVIIERDP